MSYGRKKPRKPIYDPESGIPPTEGQILRMRRQADNVAKYWIEQKRMTVSEMREKLEKKKLLPDIIDSKIASMKEEGLLNDASYVEDFVYFKQEYMSERKMRETMLRKGLDAVLVDEALTELDEDEQRAGALRVALRRARGTKKEQDVHKRRNKIVTSVVSKGYSFSLADSVSTEAIIEVPVEEPYEDELSDSNEEERADALRAEAYKLAESKVRATRSKTDQRKRSQSIIQSLIRKGYSFSLAKEVAEEALQAETD